MHKLKIVEGFAGSQVQVVKPGRIRKIDLDKATKADLEFLHKMKHPAVEEDKPPAKKTPPKEDKK